MKSKTTALILSIFLGGLGVDRFYLGYTGLGILKLLTGGVFGIMSLVDIIMIATGSLRPADGSPYQEEANQQMNQAPVQPAVRIPPQAASASNPYEDLQKLAELYQQGILTENEYARMKAECLSRM